MSAQEDAIKLEMRLSAIEYLLCRLNVALIRQSGLSDAQIEASFRQFLDQASRQLFPGLDPAMSDLSSAEWTEAVEKLVNAQRDMLAQLRAGEDR